MTAPGNAAQTLQALEQALRRVCVVLPHLSGLAREVRLAVDERVETMGVFASGRVVANPAFVASLAPVELAFVVAHEVLHLALDTSGRAGSADARHANCAHDLIINDILEQAFGILPPAGGLRLKGARSRSLEDLVAGMRRGENEVPESLGFGLPAPSSTALGGALVQAGLAGASLPRHARGDVLDDRLERDWFGEAATEKQEDRQRRIRSAAARAASLGVLKETLDREWSSRSADVSGEEGAWVAALRRRYRTPWEAALQRWIDAVAPASRSFSRPSRRAGDRTDVVLPGRRREGWRLHVVLDTSGSMSDELPRVLGALASFCEGAGASEIRVLQCDTGVKRDEVVDPESLARYEVLGGGGSDLSPAMTRLAKDPEVEAVAVLTDGEIEYPTHPPPYRVLWVLMHDEGTSGFNPPYGHTIALAG